MLFSSGIFDVVEPNSSETGLPLRLTISPEGARTTARLLLLVPVLCVLSIPAALSVFLLVSANSEQAGLQDGLTLAALTVLPVLWLTLAVFGALSVAPRLSRRRVVTISPDHVNVLESYLSGIHSWRLPLRTYRGVAHHIRATAGVVTHEIILVHTDPSRSLLLHTAPMVSQANIDHFCTLLRLPAIASREVYRTSFHNWLQLLQTSPYDSTPSAVEILG